MTKEERIAMHLKGAIDLHIHADPSFMARTRDIMSAAEECCAAGMRAIACKDHYVDTGVGTYLANKYMRRYGDRPFTVFGVICMNNEVGFRPRTIEASLLMGTKIVYLPSIASVEHLEMLQRMGSKHDHVVKSKKSAKPQEAMYCLDENGELKPELREIMQLIKEYDAILSTGHVGFDETVAVAKYAKEIGLERLSLTHLPHFTNKNFDYAQLDPILELGGYIEANLCMMDMQTPEWVRMDEDEFCRQVRYFTPDRCTLCSDAGNTGVAPPVERYKEGLGILIDHGFTDEEIHKMAVINPGKLCGIES